MTNNYHQTWRLLWLNLRRDRLRIGLWLLALAGLMIAAAAKFGDLYNSSATIATITTTLQTPAMVALLGPAPAAATYSTASIYIAEMTVFMGLAVAMMAINFTVHATRGDEESGLLELIQARAVGRYAALAAAGLELMLVMVLLALTTGIGLNAVTMSGATTAGNWLFTAALAAFGLMFGATTLLFAQIAGSSRAATIIAYGWLGLLYVARMLTDVQAPERTWWTIYGWIEQLGIYHEDSWLPIGLMLGFALVATTAAFFLSAKRDLGAGLLPQRQGRATASDWLRGPFSLIARLQRTSTTIWLISLFILGATYGAIFGTVGDLLKSNPAMAQIIGTAASHAANRTLVLTFANKLSLIFVVLATVPALMTVLRLNTDERRGYLEPLHARAVSRTHLYAATVIYALLVGIGGFLLVLMGMIVSGRAAMPDAPAINRFLSAGWGFAPALIVTVGLAALLVALLPRWQQAIWVVPLYGFTSLYLGNMFALPTWAQRLTPYGWVNQVPLSQVDWLTASWMLALGGGLLICGLVAYARRDLTVS